MKIAELFIKLGLTGVDKVERDLKAVKKDLKETADEMDDAAKSAGYLEAALEDVGVAGKYSAADIYKGMSNVFASMTPGMASIAGATAGATIALAGMAAAVGGLTIGAYAFAFNARNAGMEVESMQRRLEGLVGSAERAKNILALAKFEAGPSMFTTQQLEQASVGIAAYGMNVERILPLITRLGQAFGADQEHLMMYVRAFGQLGAGQMPDTEVMGQMGISKGTLAKEGVRFDKGGTLLSSTEETMAAFERIIMTKFDAAYRASTTTTEAMQASITDAMQGIERSLGSAVNNGLKPFIGGLGELMKMVAESDLPRVFGEMLMQPLAAFGGTMDDLKANLIAFVSTLGATVNIIPGIVGRFAERINKLRSGSVGERIQAALGLVSGATISGAALDIGKAFETDANKLMRAALSRTPGGVVDESRKRDPFGGPGRAPETPSDKKHKAHVAHALQAISNNTKRSADLLDLRTQTIGGGRLGAIGLTGPELAGMGMRRSTELSRAKPVSSDTMVTRGIKQMIQNNAAFTVNRGAGIPVR